MKNSKGIIGSIVAVAIISAVWFGLSTGKTTQPVGLIIGIGTFSQAIDYAPVYVARNFGWFEDELRNAGVHNAPRYFEFNSFDEIQNAFNQNRLHAFFSAEAPATKLRSDKQDIRIVEVGCTLQQEIVVRSDLNISSVSQLKGKKIAVAEGTSSHYGLLQILATAGLGINDIILRPGFPGEAKPLFETGAVDAWAVWPPFIEEQVIMKHGAILQGGDAKIQSVMSVPHSLLTQQPKAAKALVNAIQKAKQWLAANPDEAQKIIAKRLKLDSEVVALAWPKHNWGATLTDDVTKDIQKKSKFLTEQGVVRNGIIITLDELIDKGLLK